MVAGRRFFFRGLHCIQKNVLAGRRLTLCRPQLEQLEQLERQFEAEFKTALGAYYNELVGKDNQLSVVVNEN